MQQIEQPRQKSNEGLKQGWAFWPGRTEPDRVSPIFGLRARGYRDSRDRARFSGPADLWKIILEDSF